MKVAFIHYHLKTGGVTTVLRQQIDAIHETCQTLVLTGEPPKGHFPADVIHIPGLGYTDPQQRSIDPKPVAESVDAAIRNKWRDGCDLIHIHNPTLAKNVHFLKIIEELKRKNFTLFLQIHDFAEDGRPSAYFTEDYVSDCHYGVINSRDHRILIESGLERNGVHKLPNMVEGGSEDPAAGDAVPRVLYPIRARRRKNIGEAILVSIFLKEEEFLAITLPPISPMDLGAYGAWKTFVAENHLKVAFEAGRNQDFKTLVHTSKYLITTSITEGFGFSFLDPWTAGKLLWGRKLPDICHDFETKGIYLHHLYSKLRIPMAWIDKTSFFTRWHDCIIENANLFGCRIAEKKIEDSYVLLTRDQTIDFGLLNEKFQKEVISEAIAHREAKQTLLSLNPFLAEPGKVDNEQTLIDHNRKTIERYYGRSHYRNTLLDIYRAVIRTPVHHHIDKKRLLISFFDLNTFSLLKWCHHVE